MSETFERVARHGLSNQEQAKYQAELKARTKRHGFKNMAEYQAVAGTIASVMAAIDPQTKMFRDPQVAIQKELDQLTAAKGEGGRCACR